MTYPKLKEIDCPHCEDGTVWRSKYGGLDPDTWPEVCEECGGTGIIEVEEDEAEEE